jgi:hypothetical protein
VPVISGTYCTATTITSVSGISSEANGTIVQVYEDGVVEGSTTTVSNGAWTASTGISIASGKIITAKATAPCKTQSAFSTGVTVKAKTTDASLAITTNPIIEQVTTVSGTGTNGNSIQLYIDGAAIGSTTIVAGGVWTISGLNTYDLYTSGIVTVTATGSAGTSCESNASASKTVACSAPATNLSVSPDTAIVCNSSVVANVTVNK